MPRLSSTPPRRHLVRWSLTACLAGALAFAAAPPLVRASEAGGTKSGSSNSSDSNSSNGSNDSSNSSKDSSHNGSSKDTNNNSTQNSPKNSTDYSSKGTSDWSTNSRGAHVFSIALAVVVVGASVIGTVAAARSRADQPQRAALALAAYMRQHHALLTHDVALASGPVFDAWAHDLRLGARDRVTFQRALEGSAEQGLLLDALNGPIDEGHARRFAAAFLRTTARALGPARTEALVARAARAAGDA